MNIISLSKSESVVIDTKIVVKVREVCADEVWIEIERPRGISVERGELRAAVHQPADWLESSPSPCAAIHN
jgi:sRNA-binding carbon storage regulator CsrA